MAEKRIVCFQSKKVKICSLFFIFNNYYIYLKRYFEEKNVTNDIFSIFWRTAALKMLHAHVHFILENVSFDVFALLDIPVLDIPKSMFMFKILR